MGLTDRLAAAQRARTEGHAGPAGEGAGDHRDQPQACSQGRPGPGTRPVRGRQARRACPARRLAGTQALRRPHDAERAGEQRPPRAAGRRRSDRRRHVGRGPHQDHAGDLGRHPRLRAARAAPPRPRPLRGHGQRLRLHLRRAQRQARQDRHQLLRRGPPAPHHRQDRRQDRSTRRRGQSHGRRPPARRISRQRDHPSARARRVQAHDPQVLRGPLHRPGPDQLRQPHAHVGEPAGGVRQGPAQHPGVGRHGRRQDDDAQRPVVVHPGRRADRDHRGRRRAPARAGPRAPPRVPAPQHRGQGRGAHPRPGQELPAHAPRPHRRGRDP